MEVVIYLFIFIFGICIGSFLNVVIYRTPNKISIVHGTSNCMSCHTRIMPKDLVPILSWLFLKGRCRNCGTKISPRYLFVEALTGILFTLCYMAFGLRLEFYIFIIAFSVLVVISFIDIDTMEIPYWSTITLGVLGLILCTVNLIKAPEISSILTEAVVGLLIISIPFAILALFGGMGGGDVQLMAACGLLLGYKIIPAALIGIFTGAIFGVYLKYQKKSPIETAQYNSEALAQTDENTVSTESENKHAEMVFGPFLSFGIIIATIWGDALIMWYLKLMGI